MILFWARLIYILFSPLRYTPVPMRHSKKKRKRNNNKKKPTQRMFAKFWKGFLNIWTNRRFLQLFYLQKVILKLTKTGVQMQKIPTFIEYINLPFISRISVSLKSLSRIFWLYLLSFCRETSISCWETLLNRRNTIFLQILSSLLHFLRRNLRVSGWNLLFL